MFSDNIDSKITNDVIEDNDDEELGVAEVYADYKPSKLSFGLKHPDQVVETASLASVQPTDVWYKLSIPESTISSGGLSGLQLESIVYASQQHEHFLPNGYRSGFLIGDGAGVGKGRTLAGIIFENFLKGRTRAVWISVSNDLKYDAERDLKDVGASEIPVYFLSKLKYAPILSAVNGFIDKGVLFSTYSSLISVTTQTCVKLKSRLDQIIQWCGNDFDGVIVFDECHRAKNICPEKTKPTKTGLKVLELQNKLPKARIVYASATGASEPRNMAYMVRLGIWGQGTPFHEFDVFRKAVEKRGVGALEIVAMDMKLRGMYIARQLSFHGVLFSIEEVPLSEDFVAVYDKSVALWMEAKEKFEEAAQVFPVDNMKLWGQFWSAHQRFFKYLCIAAKVQRAVEITKNALKEGKCVVIGLQSTGEARTIEQLERSKGELTEFVCTPQGVFRALVEKQFPDGYNSNNSKRKCNDESEDVRKKKRTRTKKIKPSNKNEPRELPTTKPKSNLNTPFISLIEDKCGLVESHIEKIDTWSSCIINKTNNDFSEKQFLVKDKDSSVKSLADSVISINDSDSVDSCIYGKDFENCSSGIPEMNPEKNLLSTSIISLSDTEDCNNVFEVIDDNMPLIDLTNAQNTFGNCVNCDGTNNVGLNKGSDMKSFIVISDEEHVISSDFSHSNEDDIEDCKNEIVRSGNQKLSITERISMMKENLLSKIEDLSLVLPKNTLDNLIEELGGPECVAEMTGRKGRVVQKDYGVEYESRALESDLDEINIKEKELFMDGIKNIAIISEAASSGISLQSDRRAKNQKRRVHITLELPWSADRAIQQFGRTHRSNQVNAPEYMFLITNLAGEKRFASVVAKRLESLGALTHGDRRATETRDLSKFNIDNKYGRLALSSILNSIIGLEASLLPFPSNYVGNFKKDVIKALVGVGIYDIDEDNPNKVPELHKTVCKMDTFLNKLLGIPVNIQNKLFEYFTNTMEAIISRAVKNGTYDLGIQDLGASGETIKTLKITKYFRKYSACLASIDLHEIHVDRGMSFDCALDKWVELHGNKQGFYLSRYLKQGRREAVLVEEYDLLKNNFENNIEHKDHLYILYKPHLGKQFKHLKFRDINERYAFVTADEAKEHWETHFNLSDSMCSHIFFNGHCKSNDLGQECEYGLRKRTFYVLSGCVLSIWPKLEAILPRMKVVRLRTEEGFRIVGTIIPKSMVKDLMDDLASDSENIEERNLDSSTPKKISNVTSKMPVFDDSIEDFDDFNTDDEF